MDLAGVWDWLASYFVWILVAAVILLVMVDTIIEGLKEDKALEAEALTGPFEQRYTALLSLCGYSFKRNWVQILKDLIQHEVKSMSDYATNPHTYLRLRDLIARVNTNERLAGLGVKIEPPTWWEETRQRFEPDQHEACKLAALILSGKPTTTGADTLLELHRLGLTVLPELLRSKLHLHIASLSK